MYFTIQFIDGAWLDHSQSITFDYNEALITQSKDELQPIVERLNVPLNDSQCFVVNVTERELRID